MVVLDVDDQPLEYSLHLGRHFIEQQVEFSRLDEVRDVVVGVEPPLCLEQSFANAGRNLRSSRRTIVIT